MSKLQKVTLLTILVFETFALLLAWGSKGDFYGELGIYHFFGALLTGFIGFFFALYKPTREIGRGIMLAGLLIGIAAFPICSQSTRSFH